LVLFAELAAMPAVAAAAELKQATVDAFDRYVRLTEARLEKELQTGNPFLWMGGRMLNARHATRGYGKPAS